MVSFRSQTDPIILIFKAIENNVNMANAQTYQVSDMLCYLIFHNSWNDISTSEILETFDLTGTVSKELQELEA
jgi:hypothetical protein